MSEVNINYKGSKIAGMDASGTKTLLTEGKYCEDDISVEYTRPTVPTPSYQSKSKSYTPSETAQSETVTADNGYDALSQVAVSVGAVSSTYVGSGITRRSSSDLTASGATVTVPSGYYSSQASKSVSSGSAGTPTATKGTVSNHSVSVTPSVTNTTGFITGSTKTGTAVTVSASELVSGDLSITQNGNNIDCANYSTVSVNVSGGGGGSVTQDQDGYIVLPSTGGGGGGATQHTIHLEFSDSTDTDISVYYDDSLLGTMITAYEPSTWTYSSKTVTLAQLDGTTWYDKQDIPIGVELIDYNACLDDYAINSSGQAVAQQWYVASDYTDIESGMTFSFKGCRWFYLAYYDSSKAFISSSNIDSISTPDPNDSNVGVGTLSSGIPANAKYIRITGTGALSSRLSLIRTA